MPLVTNIQPPVGDPVSIDGAVNFDVVDPLIGDYKIFVWAVFKDGTPAELVFDSNFIQPVYSFSQISSIPNGRRFSVRRVGGWPSQPELRVDTGYNPPDLDSIINGGGGGGGGEVNTASNVGGELELFQIKVGTNLQFRTIGSTDGSVLGTQNATTVDLSIGEVGGATFNGQTYTWPAAAGTFGQRLTVGLLGDLYWETDGFTDITNTFDNTTENFTVGALATTAMVRAQLSLYTASTGASSTYEITAAVDGANAVDSSIIRTDSPTPQSNYVVSVIASGGDVTIVAAGSGPGNSTVATLQTLATFTK